jgi:hypothetical protein
VCSLQSSLLKQSVACSATLCIVLSQAVCVKIVLAQHVANSAVTCFNGCKDDFMRAKLLHVLKTVSVVLGDKLCYFTAINPVAVDHVASVVLESKTNHSSVCVGQK